MFKKILIAYDESPQAKRALTSAIELAKQLGAELRIITVSEPLPVYAAYMEAAFPGSQHILAGERIAFYGNLQQEAQEQARARGISVKGIILEGHEVEAIVDDITVWQADLLVIGRRHHSFLVEPLSGSTVHEIAEKARCSILAVD